MLKFFRFGCGFLLVLFSFIAIPAAEHHMQVRVYLSSRAELLAIKTLNLDVACTKPGEYIDIVSNSEEVSRLQLLGFKTEVIHSDLERFYEERLDRTMKMGGYHTYDETVAALDSIHNEHPTITSAKINIGTTIQGRTIWAMKISDNPETDEDEPEVYYSGLIHAREPISIEILLYFMRYLTNNYGTDSVVTDIVNNRELWFVPIINPDGIVSNHSTNPNGGGMWRKNRKNNGDGTYGIDLNRNFGYKWGYDDIGSSGTPGSETYRGSAPFSEPETQALRDFINAHNFVTALNYHSYSNLLIYPWGYEEQFPEDFWIYKEIGDSISAYNGFISAPGWITLYSTNGDADDWDYGDLTSRKKIISYTPEVGDNNDGFWPPSYRILPLCIENLGPNLYIARKAGELFTRPYRFFETQPNFIDTSLVSGDSLVLDLRVYGHQLTGSLNYLLITRDSFEFTLAQGFLNGPPVIKPRGKVRASDDLQFATNSYPVSNWLRIEPQTGAVSPGSYVDHQVILDAKALPTSCTGMTLHGGIVFYVTGDAGGGIYDSIIVPVTFVSGPPRQVSAITTSKLRSDISNLTNISSINGYAWRYLDESYDYLYDGSLFLAYLKSSSDTVVYRDLFNTHSFGASSVLNIDSSDPRWQRGTFSTVDPGCNLKVRTEVLAPSHPDSSELMIHRFVVFNLTPDSVKNLYLGMVLDWDIPTSAYNSAGYDSTLNLLWQRNTGNQRYAGIAYLSDASLYGAKAVKNSTHIYNTGNFETGDLYQVASSPGYLIEGSSTDLSSVLTAKKTDLAPGDSVKFDLALVSTRVSLDSLKASVRKARAMVATYSHGDANGDKKVTISDVVYIVNYLFKGGLAPVPFLSGDANCDGAVTITDVIYLINYLFKGGPAPCG